MIKCPYCGHENNDTAEACEHCYAGFPKEKQVKPEEEQEMDAPKKKARR